MATSGLRAEVPKLLEAVDFSAAGGDALAATVLAILDALSAAPPAATAAAAAGDAAPLAAGAAAEAAAESLFVQDALESGAAQPGDAPPVEAVVAGDAAAAVDSEFEDHQNMIHDMIDDMELEEEVAGAAAGLDPRRGAGGGGGGDSGDLDAAEELEEDEEEEEEDDDDAAAMEADLEGLDDALEAQAQAQVEVRHHGCIPLKVDLTSTRLLGAGTGALQRVEMMATRQVRLSRRWVCAPAAPLTLC